MKKINVKSLLIFLLVFSVISFLFITKINKSRAEDNLAQKLAGKILLQVENNGEAWYVSPDNGFKRVFLDKPDVAFLTMVQYGVGIRSADLRRIPVALDLLNGYDSDGDGLPDDFEKAYGTNHLNADSDGDSYSDLLELQNNYDPNFGSAYQLEYDYSFIDKHKGRIFIDVESSGSAWYINPDNSKRYYLGRPNNAFLIMKSLGVGISNENLEKIPADSSPSYYANNEYGFDLELPDTWRNYLVNEKFEDFELEGSYYQLKKISFGLSPRYEDINNEYYNLNEESFTNMLNIYVLNNGDYSALSHSIFTSEDYMKDLIKIGENNHYTFLRDEDIFEQSYNNDYIYNRKQEIALYLNKINIFDVDNLGDLNSSEEAETMCKDDLVAAAGGGSLHPVDNKYLHLSNFGDLFTASSCNSERIQEMKGVTGDYYYNGSYLKLVKNPSLSLVNILKDAGYNCNYTRISDENCDEWTLGEVAELDKILSIKPYYKEIISDNCVMCGAVE